MNLIARCPACQTSYRVVPDQLRISDGWVRCGQCGEIFDASPLIADDPALGEPHAESPGADQQNSSLSTAGRPAHEGPLTAPFASEGSWASAALLIKPSSESESESESDTGEPVATSLSSVAAPVSFLLVPEGTSGTRREIRPVLWWSFGGLLLFGLLLQGLYRERDQLAASFPVMKPALVSVCELLACRVLPMQNIEELVIDTATFQQVGQESFELRFVVKNKSRFELALPTIELTLTDLADQPVVRRVFTPTELGVALRTIAPAGEWSATAYLRLQADATDARAQGYRLQIFYP